MLEISVLTIARWVHVLAGAAWLGEVIVIVFVLVPSALRMQPAARLDFVSRVFPRIFQLASVLAFTTLAAGAALNYLITGWQNLGLLFQLAAWHLHCHWRCAWPAAGAVSLLCGAPH